MSTKKIPFDERIASGFIKAPIGAGGGITEFLGLAWDPAVAAASASATAGDEDAACEGRDGWQRDYAGHLGALRASLEAVGRAPPGA